MNINWIEEGRELMLEQAKLMTPFLEHMQNPETINSFIEVLEPLEDGTVDPGDEDRVIEGFLALMGDEYLKSLRQAADVYRDLGQIYQRLRDANDEEVHAFARMSLEVMLKSTGLIEKWAKIAGEGKTDIEAVED